MNNNEPAVVQLCKLSDKLQGSIFERELVTERYMFNNLVRKGTGNSTIAVKNLNWACLDTSLATQLSDRALIMVNRLIIPSLALNNLLWYFPSSKDTRWKMAIRELLDIEIISKTEAKGMYLVNPFKIWRGNTISATECTKRLLLKHKKPSPELVRDLRITEKYSPEELLIGEYTLVDQTLEKHTERIIQETTSVHIPAGKSVGEEAMRRLMSMDPDEW